MKLQIALAILFFAVTLNAEEKIIGTWYTPDGSNRQEVWHFTEKGNILREFYRNISADNFEWKAVAGKWKMKNEEGNISSYHFEWSEFNTNSMGILRFDETGATLVIEHGCLTFTLKNKK